MLAGGRSGALDMAELARSAAFFLGADEGTAVACNFGAGLCLTRSPGARPLFQPVEDVGSQPADAARRQLQQRLREEAAPAACPRRAYVSI